METIVQALLSEIQSGMGQYEYCIVFLKTKGGGGKES